MSKNSEGFAKLGLLVPGVSCLSMVSSTMTPYLCLVAHATKCNALERLAKGESDQLSERGLFYTWWSDEAKHMLDGIMK